MADNTTQDNNADFTTPPVEPDEALAVFAEAELCDDETGRVYSWKRLDVETALEYRYFKLFVKLGDTLGEHKKRNLHNVSKMTRLSYNHIREISVRNKWTPRANDWDMYWLEQEDEARRRAQDAAEKMWAERRNSWREKEWQIHLKLVARAEEMLKWPLFDEILECQEETLDDDARVVIRNLYVKRPQNWTMADASKFFELASKFARLASGMDTDRRKVKINFELLSDEELERIANES